MSALASLSPQATKVPGAPSKVPAARGVEGRGEEGACDELA